MTKENVNELNAGEAAYIEIIGSLIKSSGSTRITEIAKALNISAPSVNEMVNKLCARGFVHHTLYREVTLTKSGWILAEQLILQQTLLRQFLVRLGVDDTTAKKEAFRLQYAIHKSATATTEELLYRFIDFVDNSSQGQRCIDCFRGSHKRQGIK